MVHAMTNVEQANVINQFKRIMIRKLDDVKMALPALVPQTKEDEILFKRGMKALSELTYDLEHADSIREVAQFLDVRKIVEDFDEESIKNLEAKINASAKASIDQMNEMMDMLGGDEEDE